MGHFDDETLEITCPTCGKQIKEKVRWFKGEWVVCPHGCGTAFDTDEFRKEIEKANEDLENFQQAITKISIKP